MNGDLMLVTACEVAAKIGALAVVSFVDPVPLPPGTPEVPIIRVQELQLDVLKDLTMHDILEVSERHMLDAAVHLYLRRNLQSGLVVGVFPYAVVIYDIEEGKSFINLKDFSDVVPREVLHAALTLALEIAVEGREGRAIGTAFIIGDPEEIFKHSHQAILNPYQGQPAALRDIKNKDNWESVKEFAQLDGVFVIDKNGEVRSAGRYLDVTGRGISLPGGLGGRHRATASITHEIPAIGITVSESGGMVRIFRDGNCKISIRSDIRLRSDG
ncbi:MAG: diadenylate cyclase [Methanoculleus sp.]|jgi:DNA integrity scanning protein DisA with diadenylate cyclase activity|nr:diadenylate cyclase [Methanoculleus sp.]